MGLFLLRLYKSFSISVLLPPQVTLFGQELVCQVTNLDITKYGHCFWEGWELIRIQLFWFNYLYHLSIQSLIISHGFWLGSHWLHLESHHNRDLSKFYAKITACCVVKCLGIFPLFAVISVEVVTQKSSVLHIIQNTFHKSNAPFYLINCKWK